jgi:hypothetical protein
MELLVAGGANVDARDETQGTLLTDLSKGTLTVSVQDHQGNITRIERTLSVAANP